MTYDRPAIEKWLSGNHTSPLTNLPLANKMVTPHPQLRDQIAAFTAKHAHLITPQSSSSNLIAAAAGGGGPSAAASGAAAALNAMVVDGGGDAAS